MNPTNRRCRFAAVFCVLCPILAGCGGGGGGSSSDTVSYPEACGKSAYLPNYADGDGKGMTLRRWKTFPVRVYIDRDNGHYTTDLQSRAVTAFDGWGDETGGKVKYTLLDTAANADVIVHFVDVTDSVLTNADAVGLTYTQDIVGDHSGGIPYDHGYLASAEVYIGLDGNTVREDGTMTHEFGHALGIGGHSPARLDVMYKSGSAVRSPTPTTSDVDTLRTAYCDDFTQSAAAESRAVVPPAQRGPRVAIP